MHHTTTYIPQQRTAKHTYNLHGTHASTKSSNIILNLNKMTRTLFTPDHVEYNTRTCRSTVVANTLTTQQPKYPKLYPCIFYSAKWGNKTHIEYTSNIWSLINPPQTLQYKTAICIAIGCILTY